MKKLLFLLLSLLIISTGGIQAQELSKKEQRKQTIELEKSQPWKVKYIIGANVTMENMLGTFTRFAGGSGPKQGLVFSPGISFETRLSRHSGLETGLYYRYDDYDTKSCNGQYLSVPLLYKFNSRVLNFAAGPNFDFLVAGTSFDSDYSYDIGGLFKLSKDIKLYKGLLIEPGIQVNYMFLSSQLWAGVGVGLKYRF